MSIYINSSSSVSSKSHPLANASIGNALQCADPDLPGIDPKLTRRMSHVIKMGMGAALDALQQSGVEKPDAIITGTAYGCLEDTGIFLKKQVSQKETMLTPTAFIQSTHNTVGGQIGLMLQCNGYNNTIVHRGFSFEQGLQDAMMLLQDEEASVVLVGASDEITTASHHILSRFHLYKRINEDGTLSANGTVAGEGAAYFVLTSEQSRQNIAELKAVQLFYKPASEEAIINEIRQLLNQHSITAEDIDVILAGQNADQASDTVYRNVLQGVFPDQALVPFKHECGEYPTATAYALHKAISLIRENNSSKNVLIYNHFQNIHHSLILLASC